MVTESKFHNDGSQILGATLKNSIDPANCWSRFVHPYLNFMLSNSYTLMIYKRSFFESLGDLDISSLTEQRKSFSCLHRASWWQLFYYSTNALIWII